MQPFAIAIFLSAFLLFQVQLLLAKYILPWFGGTPSVWTTSMLFFQTLLLAGYGYAHWLASRPAQAVQRRFHLTILAASVVLLVSLALVWGTPLLPDSDWKPTGEEEPIGHIVLLLMASIGLPFFVLSATNPLLQAWFRHTQPASSPYRLYALSNLGSLLGLVNYPLFVEVYVPLRLQSYLWAAGYLVFAAAIAWSARYAGSATETGTAPATSRASPATFPRRFLWFGLAACASVLLLATTNQMTQEIAAVPFLWMLPLALYLLSFILCFDSDRWYVRPRYAAVLVVALAVTTLLQQHGLKTSMVAQITLYAIALFIACMACHGELARLKPDPRHLTGYYLTIAAGGAGGGLFVGVVAPNLFAGFWELPIGLWLCAALFVAALLHDRASFFYRGAVTPAYGALAASLLLGVFVLRDRFLGIDSAAGLVQTLESWPFALLLAAGIVVLVSARAVNGVATAGGGGLPARGVGASALSAHAAFRRKLGPVVATLLVFAAIQAVIVTEPMTGMVASARNFYGVVAVVSGNEDDPDSHVRELRHGRILHGMQYQTEARRRLPTSYYGPHSGIALALLNHPRREAGGLRIGVVGLGVGTLATYGRADDELRFYEINPAVIGLARGAGRLFSYLDDTPASVAVIPGDGRIALARELADNGPQRFDVLAIDAFSSDAIPVHLLTREAFELYLRHLDPDDGILALNISSRYVELKPLVARLARHFGLDIAIVDSLGKTSPDEWPSDWALLARHGLLANMPAVQKAAERAPAGDTALWTDDYSNLLGVLRWSATPDLPAGQAIGRAQGAEGLDFLDRPDGSR